MKRDEAYNKIKRKLIYRRKVEYKLERNEYARNIRREEI